MPIRPHVLYAAVGFPPAAKSGAHRMLAVANELVAQGCRVTVLTAHEAAWRREFGLDRSLAERVDPTVRVVGVPVARADLEPDVSAWSRWRARHPRRWAALHRLTSQARFPEPVFGAWASLLVAAAECVHAADPVDLVLATAAPYTTFAVARALHRGAGVPYAVDFRDAWSLDVLTGRTAFGPGTRRGRLEARVVRDAAAVWVVNDPIAGHYACRYPDVAPRIAVVRNGFDAPFLEGLRRRDPDEHGGLVLGYVGTASLPLGLLSDLLEGWALARERSPALTNGRLVLHGHLGAGHARAANAHAGLVAAYSRHGVRYAGPVPRGDLAATYRGFDALVLPIIGGEYMTSGKVYEYAATGLPIMSAHAWDHDAATVLAGRPLWVRPRSLDAAALADAFVETASTVLRATAADIAAARLHAARYERTRLVRPAVAALTALAEGDAAPRTKAPARPGAPA